MTDINKTHIYFLLDRSGSMQSIKSDTEEGFAAFIAEQVDGAGECLVTLAQFDNDYEVVYRNVPVVDAPPLVLVPRSMTALLDSMGRLINEAGAELAALPEDRRPGTVIVAIMTDGMENASREYTHEAIKALVEQQSTQYSWQFLYMGADQDAIEVGRSIGVQEGNSLTYARGKVADAQRMVGDKVRGYRADRAAGYEMPMPSFSAAERRRAGE